MNSPHSRRRFLGSSAAALALAGLSKLPAADSPPAPAPRPKALTNPYVYKFNIGSYEAWSISDGHMLFNDRVDKMWPPDQRDAMKQNLIEHGERVDGIPLYVNILVLRRSPRFSKSPYDPQLHRSVSHA